MPKPYRYGVADAVMCRECKSPFTDYAQSKQYLAGYLHGKQLMKG